ncbi:MAG: FumA C-terminus/TtdB family hydratase beta subunit [Candidatus Gastranaerophilales bacterium]|nr:FumA C-terminus/TtdB family hydratase beta subunit [Candidatus Gastranaerophilales bacterium]
MFSNIKKITSEKITETVENLCFQANYAISKNTYENLKNLNSDKNGLVFENLRLAKIKKRPICQDTGMVIVFAQVGQDVHIEGQDFENAINLGVKKAYEKNYLRKSIVKDPIFNRINTNDNTPAVIYTNITFGDTIKLKVCIKGAGSENTSAVKMLQPSDGVDGIIDFVIKTVTDAGERACPPMHIGVGIGGTLDYCAVLAKKALIEPLNNSKDIQIKELQEKILGKLPKNKVFGINILTYPCHIASLPIAVNINCHATRHACAEIFSSSIMYDFDEFNYQIELSDNNFDDYIKLHTSEIEKFSHLKAGQKVLLSGKILTARDAAHKEIYKCIENNEKLPIELKNQIIFYAGPCPAAPDEIIGPVGPTTSIRMDKYLPKLLEQGVIATIGKGERSQGAIESIKNNNSVYFTAIGGIAVLLAEKIKSSKIIAYPELGAEAVHELEIIDFPITVAIDSNGNTVFV